MLSEKRALVTGSTQGIGLAIAQRLAAAHCAVILHGIEPDAQGRLVADEISRTYDVAAAYVELDLNQPDKVGAMVEAVVSRHGPIDILVNNAGVQHVSSVEDFPRDQWDRILNINLTSPFLLMQSCVGAMKARGWGRIVNISSVHGLVGSVNKTAYLATKHGLIGVTKGLALETAAHGITVNCICPGFTDTDILRPQIAARAQMINGSYDEAVQDLLREKQPNLKLLPPDHIGDAVVFLASEAGSGITGISLPIDGGWTAQ